MKKQWLNLSFLNILVLGSLICGNVYAQSSQDSAVSINLTHTDKANSPKGKSAIRFKEILEARYPGKVRVNVFEDKKMFNKSQEMEAVQLGVANMAIPTTEEVAKAYGVQDLEIFDLPFLFNSPEDFQTFLKSPVSQSILDSFNSNPKNSTTLALGYIPNGFETFIGKKFYRSNSDFNNQVAAYNGLTINKMTYNAFGTNKLVEYKSGDLLMGFAGNPAKINVANISLYDFNALDLQAEVKNITQNNYKYSTSLFLVNKKWFNALPSYIKSGIISVALYTEEYDLDLVNKNEAVLAKDLTKQGVSFYQLSDKEKENMKKLAIPVHTYFLNNINKQELLSVYQAIKQK